MKHEDLAALPKAFLPHIKRVARIAYLNPTIIRAILKGTQPKHLTARRLWKIASLPLVWGE